MTLPLIVLAALAVVGGVLNLPFLEPPAVPRALARAGRSLRRGRDLASSTATKVVLAVLAGHRQRCIGILFAARVYLRGRG